MSDNPKSATAPTATYPGTAFNPLSTGDKASYSGTNF